MGEKSILKEKKKNLIKVDKEEYKLLKEKASRNEEEKNNPRGANKKNKTPIKTQSDMMETS